MVKKKNKVVVEVFCLHRHTRNYYVVLLCSSWSSPPSFSFRRESTSESERLWTFFELTGQRCRTDFVCRTGSRLSFLRERR